MCSELLEKVLNGLNEPKNCRILSSQTRAFSFICCVSFSMTTAVARCLSACRHRDQVRSQSESESKSSHKSNSWTEAQQHYWRLSPQITGPDGSFYIRSDCGLNLEYRHGNINQRINKVPMKNSQRESEKSVNVLQTAAVRVTSGLLSRAKRPCWGKLKIIIKIIGDIKTDACCQLSHCLCFRWRVLDYEFLCGWLLFSISKSLRMCDNVHNWYSLKNPTLSLWYQTNTENVSCFKIGLHFTADCLQQLSCYDVRVYNLLCNTIVRSKVLT